MLQRVGEPVSIEVLLELIFISSTFKSYADLVGQSQERVTMKEMTMCISKCNLYLLLR